MLSQLSRKAGRVAGVRALSTQSPYVLPAFPVLLEDLERDAKKNRFIKVSKLTNLFKRVTSKDELNAATNAFKVYERKHIDPIETTVGEFIKACLQHDAGDVALNALTNNYRLGLFLTAGPLNKLLSHFYTKNDDASIIAAFEAAKKYEIKPNATTYHAVVRAKGEKILDETKSLVEGARLERQVDAAPEADEEAAPAAEDDSETKDKPTLA
ncbi:hypothetical protein DYB28_009597 [Aphanomyces astaci]|uniref:Uncharacterized protein n=1 Tax=Aphanomyces astaci TaxID=112090 RepID=A0A396ZZL3_APHAT|nr:hypothetical protein DYB25_002402 [Aphanomyces astaci]RHY01003.1 hypothetical protein DYB36_003021 [Aphanomyces astaci]RHY52518.1 hypothetical protein DYB34_005144 [Aphanomyces astaci]RHY52954.1 hypothetical protein DYB38_005035 [Aphanomyces astaci]RHY61959.1 hypothetical protein DYB30_002600 [Aphanomyces astaci]